jgi:alpha-beta hydrolase superfamily lysophospholipase
VPTIIVHGTKDRIIDVTSALTAALASGGKVVLIPGAFHSWMISDPVLGANVIERNAEKVA